MPKFTVEIEAFRPHRVSTLRGFATITIRELHLRISDLAVHQHSGGAKWVAMPAKPLIGDDGALRHDERGRIAYCSILQFLDGETRRAFSMRVIDLLLAFAPDAFDGP